MDYNDYGNSLNTIPNKVLGAKTFKEILDLFINIFEPSFCILFSPKEVKSLPEYLEKELKKFEDRLEIPENNEKIWYLMVLLYLRHAESKIEISAFSIQVINMLIEHVDKLDEERFVLNSQIVYMAEIIRENRDLLSPRDSLSDEPIDGIESVLYRVIFESKKQIINIFQSQIPKNKLDISKIAEFLPISSLKTKMDRSKALYDFMTTRVLNKMCLNGKDIEDIPNISSDEYLEYIAKLQAVVNSLLDMFITEISIIDAVTERYVTLVSDNLLDNIIEPIK